MMRCTSSCDAAAQGLMHGVVLGVDGQDLAAVLARGAGHHVAGSDEHFLVRDADALAGRSAA